MRVLLAGRGGPRVALHRGDLTMRAWTEICRSTSEDVKAALYREHGRCPSWAPGYDLKCEDIREHESQHYAHRGPRSLTNPGRRVAWRD